VGGTGVGVAFGTQPATKLATTIKASNEVNRFLLLSIISPPLN